MKIIDIKSVIIGVLGTVLVFVSIGATDKNLGDITVNSISVKNNKGEDCIWMGVSPNDEGYLITYNADGKQTMYAGTGADGGGMIKLSNTFGNATSLLSTNANEDGVINLFDRYGEFGWGMSGKK